MLEWEGREFIDEIGLVGYDFCGSWDSGNIGYYYSKFLLYFVFCFYICVSIFIIKSFKNINYVRSF